ncbi:hypothetical protein Tco_0066966 [Tanacetum coccineum]
MTSLADKSLLSGGDNKPPMLEKHLYDSWKSRMELYMMNRPHGRMILASVEKGPLVWPSITEDGVTRLKEYVELTPAEAIQADCDIKAINIILQGLPTEIYALVSQHRVAKDLWEKIKLLMQGTSLTKQERECKLYDEFDKFTYKKGETLHEYYLRFTLLLNDMNIYKMPLEQFQVNTKFLNTLPDEWSKFVTDVKLVKDLHTTNVDQLHAHLQQHERHAIEVRLMHERNPDPLALVASHHLTQPAYQSHLHTHPQSLSQHHVSPYKSLEFGRQTTYAAGTMRKFTPGASGSNTGKQRTVICYNCKGEGHIAKQIALMANLSRNGSNALTEVHNPDNLNYDLFNQSEQIMTSSEQSNDVKTVQNSNIIPFSAQQGGPDICLCLINYLPKWTAFATTVNKALTTELDRYKEEVKDLKEKQNVENSFSGSNEQFAEIELEIKKKTEILIGKLLLEQKIKANFDNIIFKRGQSAQTVHMMNKYKICYDHSSKHAIGFEKPFCLKKAWESKPKLYDGNTILKMDTIVAPDSDETLELSEESRSKMLLKEQDPV